MPVGNHGRKRKFFERFVDNITSTVKDNPNKLLQEVNDMHPNLEFTHEILKDKHELAFLGMAIHVIEQKMTTCKW